MLRKHLTCPQPVSTKAFAVSHGRCWGFLMISTWAIFTVYLGVVEISCEVWTLQKGRLEASNHPNGGFKHIGCNMEVWFHNCFVLLSSFRNSGFAEGTDSRKWKEKQAFLLFCSRFFVTLTYGLRYSRSKKLKILLVFCSLNRYFAIIDGELTLSRHKKD